MSLNEIKTTSKRIDNILLSKTKFNEKDLNDFLHDINKIYRSNRTHHLQHEIAKAKLIKSNSIFKQKTESLNSLRYLKLHIQEEINHISNLKTKYPSNDTEEPVNTKPFSETLKKIKSQISETQNLKDERKRVKILCTQLYRQNKRNTNFSADLFAHLLQLKSACAQVSAAMGLRPDSLFRPQSFAAEELPFALYYLFQSGKAYGAENAFTATFADTKESIKIASNDQAFTLLFSMAEGNCVVVELRGQPFFLLCGLIPEDFGEAKAGGFCYDWIKIVCGAAEEQFGSQRLDEDKFRRQLLRKEANLKDFNISTVVGMIRERIEIRRNLNEQIDFFKKPIRHLFIPSKFPIDFASPFSPSPISWLTKHFESDIKATELPPKHHKTPQMSSKDYLFTFSPSSNRKVYLRLIARIAADYPRQRPTLTIEIDSKESPVTHFYEDPLASFLKEATHFQENAQFSSSAFCKKLLFKLQSLPAPKARPLLLLAQLKLADFYFSLLVSSKCKESSQNRLFTDDADETALGGVFDGGDIFCF